MVNGEGIFGGDYEVDWKIFEVCGVKVLFKFFFPGFFFFGFIKVQITWIALKIN